MDPRFVLVALGGCARWSALRGHVRRRDLARAVAGGTVRRVGRSYELPDAEADAVLASRLKALRSHTSAARHHGLALPPRDAPVDLTIHRGGHRPAVPRGARLHYRDHSADERMAGVTDPVCTVLDCLRDEPLGTALSVGDSALRSGLVVHEQLATRVAALRGPGSRRVKDRFALLDARAENAFESCCRAILIAAGIGGFRPQVVIRHRGRFVGRVDLAHVGLRLVIECDGYDAHGGRDSFVRDLVRHTNLAAAGWRTLRFTWEQVMFQPQWVLERVLEAIALAEAAA